MSPMPSREPCAARIGFLILVTGLLAAAGAPEPDRQVPAGARAFLSFTNGTGFLLGDIVELTFTLSNAGPASFRYETGGDYRGTGFPTRYQFTVTDEQGTALAAEPVMHMGGLSGFRELRPGETHEQALRLQNHVRVDRPGRFRVRVVHDFGWQPTVERPWPVAEATIHLALPTAAEAGRRVQAILARPTAADAPPVGAYWTATEFRYLSHPVFLDALEQEAAAGTARAMEGIHRMPSTNATAALQRLLGNPDPEVAHAAALFLGRRMPPRVVEGHPRLCLGTFFPEDLRTQLWLPAAAEPLRAAAIALLRSTNVTHVRTGACLLETLGRVEEGPLVLAALGPVLRDWKIRDKPEDNILNAPGAGDALLAVLAALRERGYRAPRNGGIEVILAGFLELADPALPRRPGWEQTLEAFFSQNPPLLREAAVRALPRPVTGKWEKLLLDALSDRDRGVQREACQVAGTSGGAACIEPLANIIRTERHPWVVRAASEALVQRSAHWAATEAWVDRMADEELWNDAMTFLAGRLEHPRSSGSSSNLPAREARVNLRRHWQRFLARPERQQQIREGKPVTVTDAEARELLGGAFQVSLEGGGSWPPASR